MKFLLGVLPTKFKVWLFNILYKDLAAKGDAGDTELAHINSFEANLLMAIGGSGTINKKTGLKEFKGGGGGGGPTTQTSYSTNLPEYAKPYYQELLKQTGKQIYTTDAQGNVTGVKTMPTYTGSRLAGFTPEQIAVQKQVSGLKEPEQFGQATTGLNYGQSLGYGTAAQGIDQALAYEAGDLERLGMTRPGTFGAPEAAAYMSPYQQAVTNTALREAQRQADLQSKRFALGAMGRGTFGGARQSLMQGQLNRETARTLGDIQAKGSQDAFLNAQQQFERDRAAGMSAEQATLNAEVNRRQLEEQARQYQAGLGKDVGLAGLQAGIDTSAKLGALGATQQATNLERLKAMASVGAEKQAMTQRERDLAYQTFMEKQNYQKQQLDYLSQILRGNASALGSTQTQYTPAPSTASQVAGLGLAGLSLANILGKG